MIDAAVWLCIAGLALAQVVAWWYRAQKEESMNAQIQKLVTDVSALKASVSSLAARVAANTNPDGTATLSADDVAALGQLATDLEGATATLDTIAAAAPPATIPTT